MRVKAFESNRWLLWEHQGCPWVWVLKPIDQGTTRLITRGRNRYTWKDVVFPLGPVLMELGDPFMMRKQLRNLKRRAEQLAAVRRSTTAGTGGQEGTAVDSSVLAPTTAGWRSSRPKPTSTGRRRRSSTTAATPAMSPNGTSR
jgi:hypothetical protein